MPSIRMNPDRFRDVWCTPSRWGCQCRLWLRGPLVGSEWRAAVALQQAAVGASMSCASSLCEQLPPSIFNISVCRWIKWLRKHRIPSSVILRLYLIICNVCFCLGGLGVNKWLMRQQMINDQGENFCYRMVLPHQTQWLSVSDPYFILLALITEFVDCAITILRHDILHLALT